MQKRKTFIYLGIRGRHQLYSGLQSKKRAYLLYSCSTATYHYRHETMIPDIVIYCCCAGSLLRMRDLVEAVKKKGKRVIFNPFFCNFSRHVITFEKFVAEPGCKWFAKR